MHIFFAVCPKTFYGEKCNQRCGKCKDNMTCDYKTGICKNGCKDHWTGEKCQQQLFRGQADAIILILL